MSYGRYSYTIPETTSEVLMAPHYVILKNRTVYENDGWGGTSRVQYFDYLQFTSKEDWLAEIENLTVEHEIFRALEVWPAKITTNVSVEVPK